MRNQSNNFLLDGATNNDTLQHRLRAAAAARRDPGVQDPHARLRRRVRPQRRLGRQRRDARRARNDVARRGWEFNRDDALQARNFFAVTQAGAEAEPVRRHGRRAARAEPRVRVRLLRGLPQRRGTTDTRVVLTRGAARRRLLGGAAIRDPLTGQPFPGNMIPADRIDPIATRLLDDFVPLPNQPGNRYTQSPDVERSPRPVRRARRLQLDDRATRCSAASCAPTPSSATRSARPNFSPAGNVARARCGRHGVGHRRARPDRRSTRRASSINRIDAKPTVTSGLDPRDLGFNVSRATRRRSACRSSASPASSRSATRSSRSPSRVNDVWQFADDVTLDRGPALAQVRRRDPPRARCARLHQPPQRRLHLQRRSTPATPPPTSCSACRSSPGRRPAIRTWTATRWATAVYVQDEFRVTPTRSRVNAGVRYELRAPFVEQRRQAQRVPPRPAVDALPERAGRPRLSGRSGRAARHLRRPTRTTSRRASASAWDRARRRPHQRARGVGPLLRRARRAGRLLPERHAGAAVQAADRGQLLGRARRTPTFREPARRRQPAAPRLPAGADLHRLGRATSRRRWRSTSTCRCSSSVARRSSASKWPTSARAARHLPIFMEVNPTTPLLAPTPRRARASAGVRPGAADVLGGASRGTTRCRPARACAGGTG